MDDERTTVMDHPHGTVRVIGSAEGKRSIHVDMIDHSHFCPVSEWCTGYDDELIAAILEVKGPGYLCDEIMRDEDPGHVPLVLERHVGAYLPDHIEREGRILDFGCGCGSSSLVLSRLFPKCEIVGIELVKEYIEVAQLRARKMNSRNIEFSHSKSESDFPADLGTFNYIVMSAVYEHLLPLERQRLLPKLWSLLRAQGVLLLGQTPFRWFPIEAHTTGLPLLNYMPAPIALRFARRFSKRINGKVTWEELLRGGIRGGSVGGIIREISSISPRPQLLRPSLPDIEDRIDLWYSISVGQRKTFAKKIARLIFKAIKSISGRIVVPNLMLAFQKSD